MAKTLHPFRRWLRTQRLSYRQAAELCAVRGHSAHPDYIKQIAIGWCRPGYDFACFLSEKLTNGAVSVSDFMDVEAKKAG